MRKFLASLIVGASLLTASVVHAEVKIYDGVGEYYMSDFETPNVAQQRAKQRAEQNACEQAGVFVKSFSRTKNFELVDDEVITMTNGILKIIDVQYHRENFDNNTTLIRAMIKAQIDSDDVLKWLDKDFKEKFSLIAQNEEYRKVIENQDRQIAELKRRLVNNPQDKTQIIQEFSAEDKIFLSNQKLDEAAKLQEAGHYNAAIKIYNEAIFLNENNATAYLGRGNAYDNIGQYDLATQDYDTAIKLNPNYAEAYNSRGLTSMHGLQKHIWAIMDYTKAIELKPNYAAAYNNRGYAYWYSKRYSAAIQDYDKAIQLNPNYVEAYNNRGNVYFSLEQYYRAIQDYDRALFLRPNWYVPYNNRGNAYQKLGDNEQAQADFDKAKQLSGADK